MRGRHRVALARQVVQEGVPQRARRESPLAARACARLPPGSARGAARLSGRARTRAAGTGPTGTRWPPRAASRNDRNSSGVIVSRMSSCATSTFRIVRIRFSVCCARCGVAGARAAHHVIELVQELLEPQLVDLVNDDEEHLVVLGPLRARLLQREELVDAQVAAVGDGGIGHADRYTRCGCGQVRTGAGRCRRVLFSRFSLFTFKE